MLTFTKTCKICFKKDHAPFYNHQKFEVQISYISKLIIVRSQIRKYGWEKVLELIIVRRTIIWTPRVCGIRIELG